MLTLGFETNENLLLSLYSRLGIRGLVSGANFVFFDDSRPVGLWRMRVEENCAVVDEMRYLEGVEDDDVLFFTHAMLFKLSESAPMRLKIKGERKEFYKFGFEYAEGYMDIFTASINLHGSCPDKRYTGR